MKKNIEKTNVMRVLDQKKVSYKSYCYVDTGVISGMEVADVLGQDPARVFKTLVTEGSGDAHYVFLVPVEKELTDTLERLYKRLVPADVREYIEDMEMENKEKSGSKKKAAAAENEPEEISHSAPPMAGI